MYQIRVLAIGLGGKLLVESLRPKSFPWCGNSRIEQSTNSGLTHKDSG